MRRVKLERPEYDEARAAVLTYLRTHPSISNREFRDLTNHDYDQAIHFSREALRQRSDFVGAHRVLTASLGMSGQKEAAKVALAALLRAQPNFSLAWLSTQMPFEREMDRAHYLEGFRRAGLG